MQLKSNGILIYWQQSGGVPRPAGGGVGSIRLRTFVTVTSGLSFAFRPCGQMLVPPRGRNSSSR
jgi:hypothetical protein